MTNPTTTNNDQEEKKSTVNKDSTKQIKTLPMKKTKLEQKNIDEIETFMDNMIHVAGNSMEDKRKYFQENLPDYGKSKNAEIRLYLCQRDPIYLRLIDEKYMNPAFLSDILDQYRHHSWNRRFIENVPIDIVRENEKLFLKMISHMEECECLLKEDEPMDNKKIIRAFCEYHGNSFAWLDMSSDRIHEDTEFVKEMLAIEIRHHGFFHPYFYHVVTESKKINKEVIEWWTGALKKVFPDDYKRMVEEEEKNNALGDEEALKKYFDELNSVIESNLKNEKTQNQLKEFDEFKEKVKKKFEDTKKEIYDDFVSAKPKIMEMEDEDGKKVSVLQMPNYHDKLMEAINKEYKIGRDAIRKRMIDMINMQMEYESNDGKAVDGKVELVSLNTDETEEIYMGGPTEKVEEEEETITEKMENMNIGDIKTTEEK